MDYFSKFLRTAPQPRTNAEVDYSQEFHQTWVSIKETLLMPDERQLTKGIQSTNVPAQLQSMLDALVNESTRVEEGGTGACLEYLLKNDVLGTLVRLSETDRPAGIQAEVLRTVSNMVVLLDEQFLVHSAVHKAVLRLLRNCVGDDLQEQLDGKNKLMGAAGNAVRSQVSEYEKDLVNLLCILCSRIRTYRELLMIFFHDKHWYRSEPLFSVDEEDEEEAEDEDEDEDDGEQDPDDTLKAIKVSLDDPQEAAAPPSSEQTRDKKPEYEFLLFNYLLRFVHREGHIGEFARAGLLFLMDVAMSPGEMESQGLGSNPGEDPVNDAALALAEYIVDGDFSDVLGAGLSAVYSLLPSKLGYFPILPKSNSDQAMTIGSTGTVTDAGQMLAEVEKNRDMGIEDARSPEFKAKIDHFLTLLLFLQDVLRRNVSREGDASALVGNAIVQSILDAVRRIFLENVLYPTILECSDLDGSAVAVMSYVEIMVRTLRQGPLADSLVDFLVSEDNDDSQINKVSQRDSISGSTTAASSNVSEEKRKRHKRRQSSAMLLLEMEAPDSRKPTDYFTAMARFTLKDLILANLRSTSSVAATTAMQLLTTLLTFQPRLTIERVLFVIPDSSATAFPHPTLIHTSQTRLNHSIIPEEDEEEEFKYPVDDDNELNHILGYPEAPNFVQPHISFSTHEREVGLYLALVSRVNSTFKGDSFSTGYDHYLHDALLTIQAQPVYWEGLEDETKDDPTSRYKHRLNTNDPILSTILESLTTFFANPPDLNVGLTAVLATLATHPDRSLSGWLTFAPTDDMPLSTTSAYNDATFDVDGDDRSLDFDIERKLDNDTASLPAASLNDASRPVVYSVLQDLVNQLERYRQTVDNFDKYLLERRQGLLFSENLSDALNLALDLTEEPKQTKPGPEVAQVPKSKPRQSTASSIVSFLSPRKSKPTKPSSPSGTLTPPKKPANTTLHASPFGNHYQQTSNIKVEPYIAVLQSTGRVSAHSKGWAPDEDVFGSAWGDDGESKSPEMQKVKEKTAPVVSQISLSQLLDNVVILEECIKELAAIIHARRSLGIDALRYL
ncbi:Retinoic acid induced 16-like protein-domain-containing protein [Panaeolus papilionaceus]|nr:Retinoic acid induced 16-like protein-domain-containing protein [Panaeolus papilionaceus]